jgi:cardiolipin synthase
MQNKLHLLMIFSLTMVSCQGPILRQPSSEAENKKWNELRTLQQKKFELQAASLNFEKKKRVDDLERTKKEIGDINVKISAIENHLEPLESGWNAFYHSKDANRLEEESIELNDINLYGLDKKVKRNFSTYEARSTNINLQHTFFTAANYTHFDTDREKPYMTFTMKCDGPFAVKYGFIKKNVNAGAAYSFRLKDKKQENDSTQLILNPGVSNCDVRFVNSLDDKSYGFALQNEEKQLANIESLVSTTEKCTLLKNSEHFIDTTLFPNMTCPQKFESIEPLPEPENSLHARVVALLGQDLPRDFIKNANPFATLDFSKAPKYDAILVSYLVFRADFYGTLIGRLLAHHADQGALVRIIVSDVIALEKDEAMFEKLQAEHPNMKVTRYRFDDAQGGGAKFSQLHRTNHVKLFIAYSKDDSKDSFAIIGGRNIHDGFVFKTPVDVSAHPQVVNYVSGDESWAYWRDFEMVIKGQDFVESLIRHYMNFYHINKENLVMKIPSVAVANENVATTENGSMRHMLSIPFKDDPNLNLFYAKMIDSAKKKILISSPYFRPVKEIGDALDRAIERGVDITVITRLDLEGDTADFILGAVNKDGVNKYLKKVRVYEYIEPKVILHSKLLLVDDEVSFVSSVNLNKRSFYHDLENGVVINDRDFTVKMGALYTDYIKLCKPLTEKQKIVFWKKWLIGILDKVF